VTNSLLRIIVDHIAFNSNIDCKYSDLDSAVREALKALVYQMNNGEKTVDFFGNFVLESKTKNQELLQETNPVDNVFYKVRCNKKTTNKGA